MRLQPVLLTLAVVLWCDDYNSSTGIGLNGGGEHNNPSESSNTSGHRCRSRRASPRFVVAAAAAAAGPPASDQGGGPARKYQTTTKKTQKKKKKKKSTRTLHQPQAEDRRSAAATVEPPPVVGPTPDVGAHARQQQQSQVAAALQRRWMRAVAQTDPDTLTKLLRHRQAVPFDTEDCADPDRTCVSLALQGWHHAMQSEPDKVSTAVGGRSARQNGLLATLGVLASAGVNMSKNCPVVDAVHFRLVDGLQFLLERTPPGAVAECLAERDFFGSNVFHVLGASMASGFARWFLALRFTHAPAARREVERQMGLLGNAAAGASVASMTEPPDALTFRDIHAALGGDLAEQLISAAIAAGADVGGMLRTRDLQGRTPLMLACAHGNAAALRVFLTALQREQPGPAAGHAVDWAGAHAWANRTCRNVATSRSDAATLAVLDQAEGTLSSLKHATDSSLARLGNEGGGPEHRAPGLAPGTRGMALFATDVAGDVAELPVCGNHCGWAGIPLRELKNHGLVDFVNRTDTTGEPTRGSAGESPVAASSRLWVHPHWAGAVGRVRTFDYRAKPDRIRHELEAARRVLVLQDEPVLLKGAADAVVSTPRGWDRGQFLMAFGDEEVDVARVPHAKSYARKNTRQKLGDFVHAEMGAAALPHRMGLRWPLSTPTTTASAVVELDWRGDMLEGSDWGVNYVFDSHLLQRTQAGVLGQVVGMDLEATLLRREETAKGSGDGHDHDHAGDDIDTCLLSPTNFSLGLLRLRQLALGGALSGASPHFHGFAVNTLLQGARLWFFAGPTSEFAQFTVQSAVQWWTRSLPPILQHVLVEGNATQGAGVRLVLQWPGDIVVIPTHWSHATLNLADTIAIALEFANV